MGIGKQPEHSQHQQTSPQKTAKSDLRHKTDQQTPFHVLGQTFFDRKLEPRSSLETRPDSSYHTYVDLRTTNKADETPNRPGLVANTARSSSATSWRRKFSAVLVHPHHLFLRRCNQSANLIAITFLGVGRDLGGAAQLYRRESKIT